MLINILKCHGSGNDFILIDEWSNGYKFSEQQRVILSQTLCDRKSSLGADGILFFSKSDKADASMRIFNSDGSEAEMCGNGLRCLARYALELLKRDNAIIETIKENLEIKKCENLIFNNNVKEMSKSDFLNHFWSLFFCTCLNIFIWVWTIIKLDKGCSKK